MSLPAIRAIRERFPNAHVSVLARPWVADLYSYETSVDTVIPYTGERGVRGWKRKWSIATELRASNFDCAILLQNAFEAALLVRLAGIPRRIGYDRDARGWLLTDAIAVPKPGEVPRHEQFYYLELLRRAGISPRAGGSALSPDTIRLDGVDAARHAGANRFHRLGITGPVIGVSPGAAYGSAKRWPPDRFAESARRMAADRGGTVALFGSASERPLCEAVSELIWKSGCPAIDLAGQTTLREFIELAAGCCLFLTNDSGAMHIASALGVPTIAVFGATDHTTTGPTGPLARVVREDVECSPCLLRECPIDHRCMTRVTADRVALVGRELSGH